MAERIKSVSLSDINQEKDDSQRVFEKIHPRRQGAMPTRRHRARRVNHKRTKQYRTRQLPY